VFVLPWRVEVSLRRGTDRKIRDFFWLFVLDRIEVEKWLSTKEICDFKR